MTVTIPRSCDPALAPLMEALGAAPGDTISLEPQHPTEPVAVMRCYGFNMLRVAQELVRRLERPSDAAQLATRAHLQLL